MNFSIYILQYFSPSGGAFLPTSIGTGISNTQKPTISLSKYSTQGFSLSEFPLLRTTYLDLKLHSRATPLFSLSSEITRWRK